MNRLLLTATAAVLLGLTACGGGSSGGGGAKALGLSYVNPTGTSGSYALMLDTSSTATNLVLNVVGPSGDSAVGVTFGFDVDATRAAWGTSPVLAKGTVFTGTSLVAQGWVKGATLQGIVSYKGLGTSVSDLGAGTLGRITLQPVSGAAAGTVSLTDVGLGTVLDRGGTPIPIKIKVGTLTLQ